MNGLSILHLGDSAGSAEIPLVHERVKEGGKGGRA